MSDLGSFGISKKLVTPTLQWHIVCVNLSFGHKTAVFGIRDAKVISLLAALFQ